MIRVICPSCQTRFNTSDTNAGKVGRCPKCNSPLRVPPLSRATVAVPQAAPPAAPTAAAALAPQPAAAEPPAPAVRAGGNVGMGQAFRWIGEGIAFGLRNVVPLTLGLLIMVILATLAWSLCIVPGVFLEPPLLAGFVLIMLAAARGQSGLLGRLFAGFSGGRYWPSMGIFWLLALIFTGISIPITLLVMVAGASSVMLLVSEGVIGLLVLAIAIPVIYSPMMFVGSRLAWAMPLVVDGRARVVESLTVSWRLTGKVARGFGLFVQMLVLALLSLVVQALIVGAVMAIFGLGGLAAVSATGPKLMAYQEALDAADRLSAMPGETADAFHARRVNELYRRLERPLPPRPTGENDSAYWFRVERELKNEMAGQALGAAGALAAAGIAGSAIAALVYTVLVTALGAVLAMPGMVGYRDMCRLVQPAGS